MKRIKLRFLYLFFCVLSSCSNDFQYIKLYKHLCNNTTDRYSIIAKQSDSGEFRLCFTKNGKIQKKYQIRSFTFKSINQSAIVLNTSEFIDSTLLLRHGIKDSILIRSYFIIPKKFSPTLGEYTRKIECDIDTLLLEGQPIHFEPNTWVQL